MLEESSQYTSSIEDCERHRTQVKRDTKWKLSGTCARCAFSKFASFMLCSSWSPCDMLQRITFMPAWKSLESGLNFIDNVRGRLYGRQHSLRRLIHITSSINDPSSQVELSCLHQLHQDFRIPRLRADGANDVLSFNERRHNRRYIHTYIFIYIYIYTHAIYICIYIPYIYICI